MKPIVNLAYVLTMKTCIVHAVWSALWSAGKEKLAAQVKEKLYHENGLVTEDVPCRATGLHENFIAMMRDPKQSQRLKQRLIEMASEYVEFKIPTDDYKGGDAVKPG